MTQTCGNCKWSAGWQYTAHNPPRFKNHAGRCTWPEPQQPLPDSITGYHTFSLLRPRNYIWPNNTGCPCWTAKDAEEAR